MPQGKQKLKNKAAVPSSKKQKASAKVKALGINRKAKGARYIAPKKSKLKEVEKLRKGMEIAIKSNIEQELKERASKEGKPFKVVDRPKKAVVPKTQTKSKKKK